MQKKKEFSVLKWIIFPLNSIVLAGIIAWFNLSVFGYQDGLPYTAIVVLIGVFSILINRYTESENRNLAKAAFIFEIVLTAALIINACYSVSVQRKMSVAKMGETSQVQTLEQITKLRGSKTQQKALDKIDKKESAQSVFAHVEDILFWIMVGELALYGLSAFTLFAIAKLIDDDEEPEKTKVEEGFPKSLEVETRAPMGRPRFEKPTTLVSSKTDDTSAQRKTTQTVSGEGLKILRSVLKLIAFRNPPMHFKVDVKDDCVWIRSMTSDHGIQRTHHAAKAKLDILTDAIGMPREAFRERLEKFLRENSFEI